MLNDDTVLSPTDARSLLRAARRLQRFTLNALARRAGVKPDVASAFAATCDSIEPSGDQDADGPVWQVKPNGDSGLASPEPASPGIAGDSNFVSNRLQVLSESIESLAKLPSSAGDAQRERDFAVASMELRSAQANLWDRQFQFQEAVRGEQVALEEIRGRLRALAPTTTGSSVLQRDALEQPELWACLFDWTIPVPKRPPTGSPENPRGKSFSDQLVAAALYALPTPDDDDVGPILNVAARVQRVWDGADSLGRNEGRASLVVTLRRVLSLPHAQVLLPVVAVVILALRLHELSADVFRALIANPALPRLGPACQQLFIAAFARIACETARASLPNEAAAACLYLVARDSFKGAQGILTAASLLSANADGSSLINMLCRRPIVPNTGADGEGSEALLRTLSSAIFIRNHVHSETSALQPVLLSTIGRQLLSQLANPSNEAARVVSCDGFYELRPSARVASLTQPDSVLMLQVNAQSEEQRYLRDLVHANASIDSVGPRPFTAAAGGRWKQ